MWIAKLENDIIVGNMEELEKHDTKFLNKMKERIASE